MGSVELQSAGSESDGHAKVQRSVGTSLLDDETEGNVGFEQTGDLNRRRKPDRDLPGVAFEQPKKANSASTAM
jgi:hypothetical protein